MGRVKRRLATAAALSAGLILAPAAAAQAADGHHKHATKAEKKADRIHDRRLARRAEKATLKPPQDTTSPRADRLGGTDRKPRSDKGVVSCAVTADRDGTAFLIHNGCTTPQTITVSVQSQPGPWHRGLCTAGGCALLQRYDLTVQPGTHSISAQSSACYYQVDIKWQGQLIRSNHFVTDCKPVVPPSHPKPKPPVQTHPKPFGHKPGSHVEGHLTQPPAALAYTASSFDLPLYAGAGGVLILVGTAITLAAPLRRYTTRSKR